jgi:hypothetical protein
MKLRLPSHRDYLTGATIAILGNLPDASLTVAGLFVDQAVPIDAMAHDMVYVHAALGVGATILGARRDSVHTSVFAAAEYTKMVGLAAMSTHPLIGAVLSGGAVVVQVGLGLACSPKSR